MMGRRVDGDEEDPTARVAVKGGGMVMEQTNKTITDNTDGDVLGRKEMKKERIGGRGGAGNVIRTKAMDV